jgi:hypothetical protein
MRIRYACGAVILCIATFSPAAAAAQTVDELVQRHIDARGGSEKLKAISTLRFTRTVATPFSSVKMVVLKKRPNLIRWEQTPAGQTAAVARAINGTGAWDTNPSGVVTPRAEPMATEGREIDADFDGLLVDWKDKGHTVALEGKEAFSTGETYKLKVTTKSGVIRYIYLDARSYLDTRHEGRVSLGPDPRSKAMRFNDVVITFADWKEVNGVKFPFAVDEDRTGGGITQSFATFTERIEANVPIDDALFAQPAGTGGAR